MKAWIMVIGLLVATTAQADVYKCKNASGQLEFQEIPCAVKELSENKIVPLQKMSVEENARKEIAAREKKKNVMSAQEFEQFWAGDMKRAIDQKLEDDRQSKLVIKRNNDYQRDTGSIIESCMKVGCPSTVYVNLLKNMPKTKVEDLIGNCTNQEIGKTHYLHCRVLLEDARRVRVAMLQMVLNYTYEVVIEVNVY